MYCAELTFTGYCFTYLHTYLRTYLLTACSGMIQASEDSCNQSAMCVSGIRDVRGHFCFKFTNQTR